MSLILRSPIVMVFGTFDLLHAGHRDFVAQAGRYGDVVAVVARDSTVRRIKGRDPVQGERSRVQRVARVPGVMHAYLGGVSDMFALVQRVQPAMIALGFDQNTFTLPELRAALKARGLSPKIIRLKSYYPDRYKTSLLRP